MRFTRPYLGPAIPPGRGLSAHRGMTLVELLTVTACLAIVAAVVVPVASSAGPADRLRAAAAVVAADLDYARLRSVTNRLDPCVVVFDVEADTYHLAERSDPVTPIDDPISHAPYRLQLGDQATLPTLDGVWLAEATVGDDETLGFGPFGQLDQAADATVRLVSGSRALTLTLDATTGDVTIGQLGPAE